MLAALLAVLLLAATVDPRLAEPLRLLAEIGLCPPARPGRAGGATCRPVAVSFEPS